MNATHVNYADCLFELGCEELPTHSLQPLSSSLVEQLHTLLQKAHLTYDDIIPFVTPRRLAVIITHLADQQPDQQIERKGPSVSAPMQAQEGFAKSCGVPLETLLIQQSDKGKHYVFQTVKRGESINTLLPQLIAQSLQNLPIKKRMRWGDNPDEFVRPVHWAVLLYGKDVVETTLFGCKTDRFTVGHRFHAPEKFALATPHQYAEQLRSQYVLADWQTRHDTIEQQIKQVASEIDATAVIDAALLDEVCGLVEWPRALLVKFDARFLHVPQEALISAMHHHQKCFHVVDDDQKMLPYFITVLNIDSRNPKQVTQGNARVMTARLSDAEFFYQTDLKNPLTEYREQCQHVLFQKQLGSLYDKCDRIAALAKSIASMVNADPEHAYQAGLFCKADLVTDMVKEFPELQGIMGYYYAVMQGYELSFAHALRDHYLPRFAGDNLPDDLGACAVAIADRLDTIVGIFGIDRAPTGDKDPFALRRAAVGLLRIMIEKSLPLNVRTLLQQACDNYSDKLTKNDGIINTCFDFIMERLRMWSMEQGIAPDVFAAVAANAPQQPFDFYQRLLAIQQFRDSPAGAALAAANKRVGKLLMKTQDANEQTALQAHLFESDHEQRLADTLHACQQRVEPLFKQNAYQPALNILAELREPVDAFFDNVMVMVEDDTLRHNRIALLAKLRALFLRVADLSLLQ